MGKSRLLPTLFFLTILAGLGWAAFYSYDKGFTKRWRQLIMSELSRRGIEAKIDKLTFDPFEGLVARNVRIYEDEDQQSVLATINNITLDIDLARLVRKEQFLNTIDLRDADISFPIDPKKPDGERIEISNFSARIQMPDETIDIQKAEFEIGGLVVNLRGALLQPSPKPGSPATPHPDTRERRQFVSDLIGEIEKFHTSGRKPRLEVELFGDLDEPTEIEASMQLRATDVTRKNYSCDRLEADIEFNYPHITLDRLLIADDIGELHGHAEHSIGGDRVTFDLESSIDFHALLRSILSPRQIGEVVVYEPQSLRMEGEYFINEKSEPGRPPVRVFGNAACGMFTSRGQMFEGFHADFSIDRERLFFRNVLLEHETGTAEAKILFDGDAGMRFSATVNLSPKIFSLFIDNEIAKSMIERFDFGRSSYFFVKFSGGGPGRDPATWHSEGNVIASKFRYNKIPVENVKTNFSVAKDVLTFTKFTLDREEGSVSGDIARIDRLRNITTVSGIKGRIDPVPTTAYFSPRIAERLKRYQFAEPPTLTLDGDLGMNNPEDHDYTVTFSSPGQARYTFLKKPLPLTAPVGSAKVTGNQLHLELETKLFGGDVNMAGDFNLDAEKRTFDTVVSVEEIDFGQLAETYEIKTKSQGTFTGNATLTGQLDSFESIDAYGSAMIYDGNVFSIPVLGPMSRLINVMMPRNADAGYSIASEASAKMQLHDGKLRADEFEAVAGGFRLKGDGTVDFVADDIDFNIQMNVRGAPGVVLHPVSRLFKYKGEGRLQDPTWRPVNFTLPNDGSGLLGGPRNRDGGDPASPGGQADRPRLLENGIPIVKPLRKGLVRGLVKGGEAIRSSGEIIIKTGSNAIKNTGERILGTDGTEQVEPPKAKPLQQE